MVPLPFPLGGGAGPSRSRPAPESEAEPSRCPVTPHPRGTSPGNPALSGGFAAHRADAPEPALRPLGAEGGTTQRLPVTSLDEERAREGVADRNQSPGSLPPEPGHSHTPRVRGKRCCQWGAGLLASCCEVTGRGRRRGGTWNRPEGGRSRLTGSTMFLESSPMATGVLV